MKDEVMRVILEIINTNVDGVQIESSQVDEDLKMLGMDSIAFIRTIVSLEEEFSCELPDEMLLIEKLNTCSKIYEVINTILSKKN